jgi:uncharacterized protein
MNTQIFTRARERARQLKVRNVLVATNTGKSIETAQDIMGPDFRFFAVGNPSSSRDKGLVLHCGITEGVRERLEKRGITVITREVPAFHGLHGNSTFENANRAYLQRFGRTFGPDEVAPSNACKVMSHVLSEFFGDGPRVCMEIVLMAADSGRLPLDEDCMAIVTPGGYSHAALVLHPVKSAELFTTRFRVKDLLLAPSDNDIWFNDGPIP